MIHNLQKALQDQIKDLYSAEGQLIKALPKVAKAASNANLKSAITSHLEETKGHLDRLEQAADLLGFKPGGKKCMGMQGLLQEGEEAIGEEGDEASIDALLIAAAQRVEHYEIAAYGTARTFAERLGHSDVASLLQQTLDEEGAADKKLTHICEAEVLTAAAVGEDADGEDEDA
jgi:ferritin-like metal-binding protein YciE